MDTSTYRVLVVLFVLVLLVDFVALVVLVVLVIVVKLEPTRAGLFSWSRSR